MCIPTTEKWCFIPSLSSDLLQLAHTHLHQIMVNPALWLHSDAVLSWCCWWQSNSVQCPSQGPLSMSASPSFISIAPSTFWWNWQGHPLSPTPSKGHVCMPQHWCIVILKNKCFEEALVKFYISHLFITIQFMWHLWWMLLFAVAVGTAIWLVRTWF